MKESLYIFGALVYMAAAGFVLLLSIGLPLILAAKVLGWFVITLFGGG